jgi:hypothetical protein
MHFIESLQITTASTSHHFHLTPYKLGHLPAMWKYRKASGTICESWEKHGNGRRTRFSSARDKCVRASPLHGTANSGLNACLAAAGPMTLHPHLRQDLYTILTSSPPAVLDNASFSDAPIYDVENAPRDTVHAWLQAAPNSDVNALAALFQLHNIIGSRVGFFFGKKQVPKLKQLKPPQLSLSSAAPTTAPVLSATPTAPLPARTPPFPTRSTAGSVSVAPPIPTTTFRHGDAAILMSGELEIQALERATNLQEVIEQLERGEVRWIGDKYGPQQGCATHSMWLKIKVTINRRERLYHQLRDPSEFNGDKDRFFKFFTTTTRNIRSRKRKADENQLEMVPYRLVVKAIPHGDKDIREERESAAYCDEAGSFSSHLWHERWGDANSWEVWRMLKKEYHYKR